MDDDLATLSRERLIEEVKRLRMAIRAHRDATGHDLCWHHPDLWGLLPEQTDSQIVVPPWPKILRGCIRYRGSLDEQPPDAPAPDVEDEDPGGPDMFDTPRAPHGRAHHGDRTEWTIDPAPIVSPPDVLRPAP